MAKQRVSIALVLVLICVCHSATAQPRQSQPQLNADLRPIAALAQRVAPWLAPHLTFENIPTDDGHDVFELESRKEKLVIRASSPSAAASGLNWYLKYYCHRSISHRGDNVGPVARLPRIVHPFRRVAHFDKRYFLNYCTLNYSLSFAGWKRWQRELDWMALNGVNLALATVGFEAVWQNTLRRVGYGEKEILDFIPGPAYQAWWLMGNLEGWGGPVTQHMIDSRVILQKKILARMKELGIEPEFQGFYGMVPASLAKKFPEAKIVEQGSWNSFRRPRVLLSSDPLFSKLSRIYYEELKKLYGPARYFGGDLFHEGGDAEGLDIAFLAHRIQQAMEESNPGAIWVLQGWQENPRDELLKGLDRNHVLVLSLDADWQKRKGFNGSPWIWGTINDFGETVGLFGDLRRVATDPYRAASSPYGRNLKGIGALMEGIDNNPVFYDLLFEVAWRDEPVDVHRWMIAYTKARYGRSTPGIERAWQLLADTAYTSSSGPESIFCARPSLKVTGASTWGHVDPAYDTAKLEQAARQFLSARNELRNVETYQVDAVDIVRQVIANRGLVAYRQMIDAYQHRDKPRFQQAAETFLTLLRRQDKLLSTRKEFLLGRWLADAKALAGNESESALFERNARTQISYWGPDDPNTDVHDYANKEWSGLLRSYYLPRWAMFIQQLTMQLDGEVRQMPDYFSFERQWARQRNHFSEMPAGDPVQTAWAALAETIGGE